MWVQGAVMTITRGQFDSDDKPWWMVQDKK